MNLLNKHNRIGTDFGLLIIRLAFGLTMAWMHGWKKWPVSENFIGTVKALDVPLPIIAAWAAVLAELVGGVLIAVGLFTRPAALFLGVTMAVAAFQQHAADPFKEKEVALAYGVVSLALIFSGPGRFSIDALIFGGKKTE